MNSITFLHVSLVLHIAGFTMLAGALLADFAISRRTNRYLITDKARAVSMLDTAAVLPILIRIGGILILLTGFAMVSIYREAVTSMIWFRIKMLLVILVLLNGAVLLRRNNNRLKLLLQGNDDRNNGSILGLRQRIGLFHGIGLLLILTIFILSVFRF
jgi:hypothetical protein